MIKVLFADAGNYCRSPAAETIGRARAAGLRNVEFDSAGLKDKHAGGPADPRTVQACAAAGYDLGNFRCREIAAADFVTQDLILAMDRENLAELLARQPKDSRARIELFLGDQDVPDPYFGSADGFNEMIRLIEEGIQRLLLRLPIS